MIFKKNVQIKLLSDTVSKQSELLNKYKMENKRLNQQVKFIQEKLNEDSVCLLKIYSINDNVYAVYFKEHRSIFEEAFEIFTYNMTSGEKICYSCVEIRENYFNVKKTLELISIDNYSESERRKGHASKHLDIYKEYCKKHDINRLFGNLYIDTPIGLDNLKSFYEKNGFYTTNTRFYFLVNKNGGK